MTRLTEDDPIEDKKLYEPHALCPDCRGSGVTGAGVNSETCSCRKDTLESISSTLCIYGYENCNEEEGYCELHQKENEA